MCTAPQNNPKLTDKQKYSGTGGHLFAIAGRKSIEYGYDGDVFGFAADEYLLDHYTKELGSGPLRMLHPFHFAIFGDKMRKIMEVYEYEWTDEQI